ncbi:hypothetical protein VPH35_026187 [Triticum aestivum]
MGISFKVKLYNTDRAGSSGDGGAGPTPPPAPGLPPPPSLDPAPVSASPSPLQPARQPPLTPIVKYTGISCGLFVAGCFLGSAAAGSGDATV